MSITPSEQPMSQDPAADYPCEQPVGEFGLLANGSSGRWDVAVDEHHDRAEWSLQLDGPVTYLAFSIHDLAVIGRTIGFLQRHLSRPADDSQPRWTQQEDALEVGALGQAEVSLLWDNEGVPRCFILIQPKGPDTIRLGLQRDDLECILEALRQVADDLPGETK